MATSHQSFPSVSHLSEFKLFTLGPDVGATVASFLFLFLCPLPFPFISLLCPQAFVTDIIIGKCDYQSRVRNGLADRLGGASSLGLESRLDWTDLVPDERSIDGGEQVADHILDTIVVRRI
jgi:hypothetical protein